MHDIYSNIMDFTECTDGCLEVENILQGGDDEEDDCRYTLIEKHREKLSKYKCFREIENDEYGHPNYSVAAYAATNNHLGCLKELEKKGVMWHFDLAICAAESGNYECLKYIIEEYGDVCTKKENFANVTDERCKKYIDQVCE
jgi:hypothetical protein